MKDYYKVLGLEKTDNLDEIKKAFRKLSFQYHPDKTDNNSESTEKFKEINEAYSVLSDENKRQQYDHQRQFGDGPRVQFFHSGGNAGGINHDDLFSFLSQSMHDDLGGMNHPFAPFMFRQQHRIQKPAPISKTIEIDICKAYTGCQEPVEIKRWILEDNVKREEIETIYVKIVEGIDENEVILIKKKGNIINETNKGDIKIFIKIINNTDFIRNGLDLILKKKITLKEALCGFTFTLNYINGNKFQVNNGKGGVIQPDTVKVLGNMGMKRNGNVGNLRINFIIDFPKNLPNETIDVLEKIL